MAKRKLIISANAERQLYAIYEYWNKRNGSPKYSNKLHTLIKKVIREIAKFHASGSLSDRALVKIKVVVNYLINYKIKNDTIAILSIRDARRNPDEAPFKKL